VALNFCTLTEERPDGSTRSFGPTVAKQITEKDLIVHYQLPPKGIQQDYEE
jgi:hypothetical protein